MKTLSEIEPILKNYIEKSKEEYLSCFFDNKSKDYILEQSILFFSKFLKQINIHYKNFFNENEEDFEDFITDILLDFLDKGFANDTIQDRVFLLKNYRGLGSISIENQGVIASFYKKYPLITVNGDLCWGYKRGGSVMRTAIVLLNEVMYDYDETNLDHTEMASDFADEVLSIFQQNEPARIEEKKIIEWILSYKEIFDTRGNYNLVKKVCAELGITQRELAEKLGTSKPTIERWAQSGEIPESSRRHIEVLLENEKLKKEILELTQALSIIKKYS